MGVGYRLKKIESAISIQTSVQSIEQPKKGRGGPSRSRNSVKYVINSIGEQWTRVKAVLASENTLARTQ